MKVLKKVVALSLCMVVALGVLAGCGSSSQDEKKLVLYCSGTDDQVALFTEGFTEQTGIEVEVINDGVSTLIKRIESEGDSPMADVLVGATRIQANSTLDLFEAYDSPEAEYMLESCKYDDSRVTDFTQCCVCFIVNDELKGDIRIEGFADLLNPELTGKIAYADPSASSNAYTLLLNMLYDMGDGDIWSDAAWDYVESLCKQINGLTTSSGDTPRGVAEGEYIVGLSLETQVDNYQKQGYPVSPVYMEEGTFVAECVMGIVKGGPHNENAKKFIDYMLSEDFQERYAEGAAGRSVREGVAAPTSLIDTSEINIIPEFEVTEEDKAEILSRFNDVYYSTR